MKRKRNVKGFTLVELMIVVAIIGILSSIGWGLINKLIPRFRTRAAAYEFASDVAKLRSIAIAQNSETRLYLAQYDPNAETGSGDNLGEWWLQAGNSSTKSTTWEFLPVDIPLKGSDDDTSEGKVDISKDGNHALPKVGLKSWDAINGPTHPGGDSNTDCLVFSPRGWLTNPAGDFSSDGYVEIQFVNKAAAAKGISEIYSVKISRSGFSRIDFNSLLFEDVTGNSLGVDEGTKQENDASTSGGPS